MRAFWGTLNAQNRLAHRRKKTEMSDEKFSNHFSHFSVVRVSRRKAMANGAVNNTMVAAHCSRKSNYSAKMVATAMSRFVHIVHFTPPR